MEKGGIWSEGAAQGWWLAWVGAHAHFQVGAWDAAICASIWRIQSCDGFAEEEGSAASCTIGEGKGKAPLHEHARH